MNPLLLWFRSRRDLQRDLAFQTESAVRMASAVLVLNAELDLLERKQAAAPEGAAAVSVGSAGGS